jgi:hypothetical protein
MDLAQLGLALKREYRELVAGAAPGAQVQRQVGGGAQRLRRSAQESLSGRDLEIAANHRRAVGALFGPLADDDAQGMARAAAATAATGELDDLLQLAFALHRVAVNADQGRARKRDDGRRSHEQGGQGACA